MEELKRQYRVIDMLLTMHSNLRDHYRFLSMATNLIIVGSSIIICASVFIDSSAIMWFGFNNKDTRMVIGLFSLLIFFLSLVSLICDWGNTAERHEHAAVSLSRLKGECRDLLKIIPPPNEGQINQWISSCRIHFNGLPIKIPEKKFNKLKAKHRRKIELSKLTDEYPGSSVIILRIIVWFRANRGVIKSTNNKVEERGA